MIDGVYFYWFILSFFEGGGGEVQKISSELLNLSCWNWVQWCITVGWSVMWKYWDAIFKVTVTAAFVANKYNILCTSLTYQSYVNNHVLLFFLFILCIKSMLSSPPPPPHPKRGGGGGVQCHRTNIIKRWLFLSYLLNCRSFCSQI